MDTNRYTRNKTEREVNKNAIKQVHLWNPIKSSNVVLLNLLVRLNSSSTRIRRARSRSCVSDTP